MHLQGTLQFIVSQFLFLSDMIKILFLDVQRKSFIFKNMCVHEHVCVCVGGGVLLTMEEWCEHLAPKYDFK